MLHTVTTTEEMSHTVTPPCYTLSHTVTPLATYCHTHLLHTVTPLATYCHTHLLHTVTPTCYTVTPTCYTLSHPHATHCHTHLLHTVTPTLHTVTSTCYTLSQLSTYSVVLCSQTPSSLHSKTWRTHEHLQMHVMSCKHKCIVL